MPHHHHLGKLRLIFEWFWFVGHAYSFVSLLHLHYQIVYSLFMCLGFCGKQKKIEVYCTPGVPMHACKFVVCWDILLLREPIRITVLYYYSTIPSLVAGLKHNIHDKHEYIKICVWNEGWVHLAICEALNSRAVFLLFPSRSWRYPKRQVFPQHQFVKKIVIKFFIPVFGEGQGKQALSSEP